MIPPWLAEKLDMAVAHGLLGKGTAHRVAMAAQLAGTLTESPREASRTALSGEMLAKTMGLSRAAVHKHVEHLRSLGFVVLPVTGAGYRLAQPFTDLIAAEAVLPFLLELVEPGAYWTGGLPYCYVAQCGSTNQYLRAKAASSPSGMVVVADEQTGGRGRLGRTWISQPGKDLTFSVLLHPSQSPAQAHLLSLAAALAVAEVVEGVPGLAERVWIKWPNDVLLGQKKVCGILLEGSMDADRLQWAVAGVGLNVNSDPVAVFSDLDEREQKEWLGKPQPVSLRGHLGHDVARGPLLAKLLARLTARWTGLEVDDLLCGLRERDALAGCNVEVLSGPPRNEPVFAGEARGIGPEGQLLVRGPSGETVAVFAGDVSVRPAIGRGIPE